MDLTFLLELESARKCRFRKGDFLIFQGDKTEYIYYLIEGECERIEYSENGDLLKYNEKRTDDGLNSLVGINNLWIPDHISFSSFRALSDVVCYRLDIAEVMGVLQSRADILSALLVQLGDKYCQLRTLLSVHREKKIPAVFCFMLLQHAEASEGDELVAYNWSNVAICRSLGIHQVTGAKIMSLLQKEKIIERRASNIHIIDNDALLAYANNKKMKY